MQEIQEITKQAKDIIREAGRYTCSKHKDYNSSLPIRFRNLVNTALETLYRIPHVILIENPEKKNEILALLNDENSKRAMLNTKPDINVYSRRIECGSPRYETKIIDDIDELLEEGRRGFDRLTGENIKYTDKLVLEFATSFKDLDVALDETMPLVLGHINRTDPRIQKYLSLVCDESLLNKENFKQLYSNTIGNEWDEWEKMKISEFWRSYPEIRNYVLSEDNISQVSPRYIKLVLTIEYGSERK
jgi:hypothetical protein